MKVLYNWLKEFVPIDLGPDELAQRLTLSGAEVERVEKIVPGFSGVVVGRIISVESDPENPSWSWCGVDIGGKELTALCAAPNARVDILTATALPGGTLPGSDRKVETRKMGNRVSEAILCSEAELGIGEDGAGIMELSDRVLPGQPLPEELNPRDAVLEIDVTPNRPDLLSHRGVARDIAALSARPLREERVPLVAGGLPIGEDAAVKILDYDLCPRYCARLIRGVKVGKSPLWLRRRLQLCGINSVNNVVDATNYMLLELGHPLHAFDFNKLAGGEIIVRRARAGETLVTIDGDERELDPSMLVIADQERPVAVAGVMGGLDTEISDDTSAVLLESAYFAPESIRSASRALGMSSDASRRFERGADPLVVSRALDRTVALIIDLAGGEAAEGMIDEMEEPFQRTVVTLRPSRADWLLGYHLETEEMIAILTRLGLELNMEEEDRLTFTVPSWRPDLTREVDLIEEVARITGFDKIPAVIPVGRINYHKRGNEETVRSRIRDLCCGLGIDEVITYSFMSARVFSRLRIPEEHILHQACEITNPVNKEQGLLRTSLLPGLLDVLEQNVNQKAARIDIFEIGQAFTSREEPDPPREEELFTLALFQKPAQTDWSREEPALNFYSLKGILEIIGRRMNLGRLTLIPAEHPLLQPGQSARIMAGNKELGFAGTLAENIREVYSFPAQVFLAELKLEPFMAAGGMTPFFRELGQYPAVRRDMALVVDESVPYAEVDIALEKNRPELLEEYHLFDLYRGDQIPEGKKSFAFSLKYRSSDDTLCDTTVNNIHQILQKSLISVLGCTFR
ncbi:MAG: phenylalanine--tRNA ligase subunit beta [Candidatus Auribacterota bacterium]|nr:phenylalanine--tRNA ligase subunit beta [Candidatus Auribacterota bacterium]